MYDEAKTRNELEARKRMMLAAPEMLTALKSGADMLQRLFDQQGGLDELETRALETMRAAIAKAEGK